jgi:Domain of unknown function (DUF4258)
MRRSCGGCTRRSGQRDYVVTTHADEEMYEDGLSIWDVEEAVLAGEIVERQRERHDPTAM